MNEGFVFPGVQELKSTSQILSHESFCGAVQSAVQSWFWPAASSRHHTSSTIQSDFGMGVVSHSSHQELD